MATPNLNKNFEIRKEVSTIFGAVIDEALPAASTSLRERTLHHLEQRYEPGSYEFNRAVFFLDQLLMRRESDSNEPARQQEEGIETWTMVRTDETLSDVYSIVEKVDTGGFSEVFLAKTKHGGRRLGIKLVNSDRCSEKLNVSLVIGETQSLLRITHPNVVEIYSAGFLRNKRGEQVPFIIMEFLDGESLDKRFAKDRPCRLEAVQIVEAIARALEFLHQGAPKAAKQKVSKLGVTVSADSEWLKPIFHSDLKPANVMMTRTGPKLIDFGALLHDPSLGEVRTAPYCAPERLLPGAVPNAQWDLFSLGGILYFLITGDTPPTTDHSQTDVAKFTSWLAQVDLGDGDLNCILRKLMAFSPSDRYRTGREAAEDLRAWTEDRPLPHARRHTYSWLDLEKLLFKRCWERDNESDHLMLASQTAFTIAPFQMLAAFAHIALIHLAIPSPAIYYTTGNVLTVFAVVVLFGAMSVAQFRSVSRGIYTPLMAYVAGLCLVALWFVPDQPFKPLDAVQVVTTAKYCVLLTAVVSAFYSHYIVKMKTYTTAAWIGLVCAAAIHGFSDSSFMLNYAPVFHWGLQGVFSVIFGVGAHTLAQEKIRKAASVE
jgi:serine/threonine protein kinase